MILYVDGGFGCSLLRSSSFLCSGVTMGSVDPAQQEGCRFREAPKVLLSDGRRTKDYKWYEKPDLTVANGQKSQLAVKRGRGCLKSEAKEIVKKGAKNNSSRQKLKGGGSINFQKYGYLKNSTFLLIMVKLSIWQAISCINIICFHTSRYMSPLGKFKSDTDRW